MEPYSLFICDLNVYSLFSVPSISIELQKRNDQFSQNEHPLKRKRVRVLSTENTLSSENEKLSKDKGKLEKRLKRVEKELEECSQRLLQEPTAHTPKDTKLLFRF